MLEKVSALYFLSFNNIVLKTFSGRIYYFLDRIIFMDYLLEKYYFLRLPKQSLFISKFRQMEIFSEIINQVAIFSRYITSVDKMITRCDCFKISRVNWGVENVANSSDH